MAMKMMMMIMMMMIMMMIKIIPWCDRMIGRGRGDRAKGCCPSQVAVVDRQPVPRVSQPATHCIRSYDLVRPIAIARVDYRLK